MEIGMVRAFRVQEKGIRTRVERRNVVFVIHSL